MRPLGLCFFILVLAIPRVFGCEAAPLELRKVTRDVALVVTHRGKPIQGIAIEIFRLKNATPVFTGITGPQGTVVHKPLAPGQYHVRASHEGFDALTEWIEVVNHPGPDVMKRLAIAWADWSYETCGVAGTLTGLIPGNTGNRLMDIVHPVLTTYPGVFIELKHAFSGELYKTLSDSSGVFIFPDVSEGVYILTIAGGMKTLSGTGDVTRIVLDVKQKSATSSLPLELRDNGCRGIEFQLKEN